MLARDFDSTEFSQLSVGNILKEIERNSREQCLVKRFDGTMPLPWEEPFLQTFQEEKTKLWRFRVAFYLYRGRYFSDLLNVLSKYSHVPMR